MNKNDFKNISLRGRVSFGINCFENTLLSLNYNVNEWRIVLEYLWEFTSIQYLDDWSGIVAEIIPDNLLEFKTYKEHDFEYLDELEILLNYMTENNILLPDSKPFERFSIEENKGWGNKFDGRSISSVL